MAQNVKKVALANQFQIRCTSPDNHWFYPEFSHLGPGWGQGFETPCILTLSLHNSSSAGQYLVLDPPQLAVGPGVKSRISLIFRHNDNQDAMLLFIGNSTNPDGNGNGYLGLDIKDNKIRYGLYRGVNNSEEVPYTFEEKIPKKSQKPQKSPKNALNPQRIPNPVRLSKE